MHYRLADLVTWTKGHSSTLRTLSTEQLNSATLDLSPPTSEQPAQRPAGLVVLHSVVCKLTTRQRSSGLKYGTVSPVQVLKQTLDHDHDHVRN